MGSNDRETRFRVLEIDRTHPYELIINENPNEIETKDIRRIVGQLGHCKVSSVFIFRISLLVSHLFVICFIICIICAEN